jgi:Transaldolase/Fructose-6-phosphate aldolase
MLLGRIASRRTQSGRLCAQRKESLSCRGSRLRTGNLRELIGAYHVAGATSNPTIFAHALDHGNVYDSQLADLKTRGVSAEEASLTADGLNLAGIRRVLELQEETRQLQAELAALREQAGGDGNLGRGAPGPQRRPH